MWTTVDNSLKIMCITYVKTRIYAQLSTAANNLIQFVIRVTNKLRITLAYQQVPHARLINQNNISVILKYVHNPLKESESIT